MNPQTLLDIENADDLQMKEILLVIAKWFKKKGLANPFNYNLVDNNGTESINLGAYGVPETFLVNKNRKILIKVIGPINNDHVKQIMEIING